jgi:hypothetical protein
MSTEWAARPSQPIQPTSTNQKRVFATLPVPFPKVTLPFDLP